MEEEGPDLTSGPQTRPPRHGKGTFYRAWRLGGRGKAVSWVSDHLTRYKTVPISGAAIDVRKRQFGPVLNSKGPKSTQMEVCQARMCELQE